MGACDFDKRVGRLCHLVIATFLLVVYWSWLKLVLDVWVHGCSSGPRSSCSGWISLFGRALAQLSETGMRCKRGPGINKGPKRQRDMSAFVQEFENI